MRLWVQEVDCPAHQVSLHAFEILDAEALEVCAGDIKTIADDVGCHDAGLAGALAAEGAGVGENLDGVPIAAGKASVEVVQDLAEEQEESLQLLARGGELQAGWGGERFDVTGHL